jgi:hypothetical protein
MNNGLTLRYMLPKKDPVYRQILQTQEADRRSYQALRDSGHLCSRLDFW